MTYSKTRLPGELLEQVLDELEPNPDQPIPVNSRRFLSQESLDRPSPPPRGCIEDIANFRLACKQFADVAAPLLFTRVVTRLSRRDLERLDKLAGWRVASHVKRFSYLVPYFLDNRGNQEELILPRTANGYSKPDFKRLQRKANERQQILNEHEDARVLKKAIAAFTSLQHVRILPLADEEQNKLLRLIRQEPNLTAFIDLDWTPACYHSSRTVGMALLDAKLQQIRFSYPKIKPQDAWFLASHRLECISTVAATLTSLTLQFEEVNGLDHEVRQLSRLFKIAFSRAENLEAIHVGFMSPTPLELSLEEVFQNITWPKLVALGIHGWNLHAEEIIDLALRHRRTLKGLRLRRVFLRECSTWKHVLSHLRNSMTNLTWISLTGIGYLHLPRSGAEQLETTTLDEESDDESDDENPASPQHIPSNGIYATSSSQPHHHHATAIGHNNLSPDEDFYDDSDSSEDEAIQNHQTDEIEFLYPHDNNNENERQISTELQCTCNHWESEGEDALGLLDDEGGPISSAKAKLWERWVVHRCLLHEKR